MNQKFQRASFDQYMMDIVKVVASRSTCLHRQQGAVIVRDKRIISAGYNGSAPGMPHCVDIGHCAKEMGAACRAEGLHAESNAIASAARMGISTDGADIYCLCSPCKACCNLIKSAGITTVKYLEVYWGFADVHSYLNELKIEAVDLGVLMRMEGKQ